MNNTKCCGWANWKNIALLALRVTVGLIFAYHGWAKLSGIASAAGFMSSVGLPGGTFWAWLVGLVEFVGGLALIVGFYTRLTAKILAIDIVVALLLVHTKGTWTQAELPLALLGGLLALSACGAGVWRLSQRQCVCEKMDGKKMEGKHCGGDNGGCGCGDKKDGGHCH